VPTTLRWLGWLCKHRLELTQALEDELASPGRQRLRVQHEISA
jgi:hypothetical protein